MHCLDVGTAVGSLLPKKKDTDLRPGMGWAKGLVDNWSVCGPGQHKPSNACNTTFCW